MTLEMAIRLTEIWIGFAFAQQSIEHFRAAMHERVLFGIRFIFSILLITGFQTVTVSILLLLVNLVLLHRFQGPYNGGADRMGLLIICCLVLAQIAPALYWKEVAFGYLALQLVLSYFISGWVKISNPDWRSGLALSDVFRFSAYPVSESLRKLSQSPRLLFSMSWTVILLELLFPFALLSSNSLTIILILAAGFHLANAVFFGLNRFFWIWIAAYPSILWLQQRLLTNVSF